jgi:Do/DeqQ family serine protease
MAAQFRRFSYWPVVLIALILLVGGLLRAGILHLPGYSVSSEHKVTLRLAKDVSPVNLGDFKNGFASIVDPALPAVVNISSTKIVKQNMPEIYADPFFRQLFGDQPGPQTPQPQMEREHSLGSGVIVNPDGYILTNNHVVSGATDVEVFTRDQRKYKAKVIGTDPHTDIAVLKIEGMGFPSFTIGDSTELKVGDIVFAIGDPFGIGETATMGIVSAKGRALGGTIEHYEDFIQTDAAINPGNSGGALIDLHGNLIGINTAIISRGGGGNEGIGFAIPINMARNVMDQIVEHGKVVRGYLGVSIQSVDPDMAKAFGLTHGGGALVSDVTPGSPAAKAGLERGDIIVKLNGDDVSGSNELSLHISEMSPGSVAHLQVVRNGQTQQRDVTVSEFPQHGQANQPFGTGSSALTGLHVEDLTQDIARQLGLPVDTFGVVVTQVDPSSAAEAAGIQRGDVIQEVDHKAVHNVAEYQKATSGLANQSVLLLLNRGGSTIYVVIEPQG